MTDLGVTVLIPLHRSARHLDVVDANIAELSPRCSMIVSDAFELDDTLAVLRDRWSTTPSVTFVGARELDVGWRAHYDDLRSRCTTEWFTWLAHDDEVDLDGIVRLVGAASAEPAAIGAFGVVEAIDEPGLVIVEHDECPFGVSPTDPVEVVELLTSWNLGTMFRGVHRTTASVALPRTTDGDEWADLVWQFAMLLDGPMVHVPEVVNRKRFDASATHLRWPREVFAPWVAEFCVDELLRRDVGAPTRVAISRLLAWVRVASVDRFEHERGLWRAERERADVLETDLRGEIARLAEAERRARGEATWLRAELDHLRDARSVRLGLLMGRVAARARDLAGVSVRWVRGRTSDR